MDDFVLQQWEEIGERINQDDFIPLQIEVNQEHKKQASKDLLNDEFEEPIQYASGPRAHTSIDATRQEQIRKIQIEKEVAEQVILTQPQIDQMLSEAYNKGREESLVEAVAENNQRFAEMEQQLKSVLSDLSTQEQAGLRDLEQEALNLSLDIAKKIIGHAVEINPEYIVKIIQEALQLSGGARLKKVRVSPQDLEFIEVLKVAQTIKEFDGSWVFEADESIKAGCILESSAGTINFELDKSWERIKDKILSLRK